MQLHGVILASRIASINCSSGAFLETGLYLAVLDLLVHLEICKYGKYRLRCLYCLYCLYIYIHLIRNEYA